ncbi:TPA: hypothetical protein N3D39_004589 [Salmonella enterica subsp. enterica serovar Durban]|nr:hypothetical protein [Salmonella enterica]HCM2546446.1 hypothetical protein [Salmonella enterica subsp. enterica serovar Durban]
MSLSSTFSYVHLYVVIHRGLLNPIATGYSAFLVCRIQALYNNGYSTKTVITGGGPLELHTSHDHNGSFELQLVKKASSVLLK